MSSSEEDGYYLHGILEKICGCNVFIYYLGDDYQDEDESKPWVVKNIDACILHGGTHPIKLSKDHLPSLTTKLNYTQTLIDYINKHV